MDKQIKKPSKRGRKAKAPTTVLPFRVPADKAKELKPIIEASIKNYLNPSADPAPQNNKPEIKKPGQKITNREPTMAELWRQMNSQK